MPNEQPTIHDPVASEPQALAYEPVDEDERDEWGEEPDEADQLPPRSPRRLLGTGGNRMFLALLAALLIAAGFIAGVQVQKGGETRPARVAPPQQASLRASRRFAAEAAPALAAHPPAPQLPALRGASRVRRAAVADRPRARSPTSPGARSTSPIPKATPSRSTPRGPRASARPSRQRSTASFPGKQ